MDSDIDKHAEGSIPSLPKERDDMPLPAKLRAILLFLERNLLLLMILAALALAVCIPGPGIAMKSLGLSSLLTFLVFFLQGLSIDLRDFRRGGRIITLFLWGFVIAYVLAPLLGYACGVVFRLKGDDLVGILLMCSMTPTLASGALIAGRAGGEKTTAIAMTVTLVFIGMLIIPFILEILLSRAVEIPLADLVRQLAFTVLIPTTLGQGARMILPRLVEHAVVQRVDKDAPAVLIGLTVYLSLAPQAERLIAISAARLFLQVLAAFLIHGALLGGGYLVSRKALAIDRSKSLAVAFVGSQKSLAMGAPIWSNLFAAAYPLAILPLIVFHAFQIVMDGFIASRAARTRS